ncbi:HAD-IA family hydrolase [Salinisphaera sp. USBA-960]|nr:HAD-IA family hydrolase [Salifodinibacter halophilus]NNC25911.1 HAD-IA family hydrolase [Salifodinibacter halophilus]
MPSLIIFDWDGTLMDSAGEIVGAMQLAIQRAGLPERSPEQLRSLIGLGIHDVLARLFPDRDPARVHKQLAAQRADRDDAATRAQFFPGVLATLDRLIAGGYELAVATGKSRRGLDQVLTATDCRGYFSQTRCADESAAKPAPAMVEDLLLRTATEPQDALVIGDTEYDVAMARAADVSVLGVTCGVHDATRLRAAGATDLITDVTALPGWLAGQAAVTTAG